MPRRTGSGDSRVFLGNLPPNCRVRDIENFFDKYGKVKNILIKQSKYGFAEFEDNKYAEDAVYDLHGKKLLGSRVTVEFAKGPKKGERRAPWVSKYGAPTRTKYALKVFNLSSRVSWQDLKDLFRKAGEVCFAEAHIDRRNEARVEFQCEEDLDRVIRRYQGYDINGRKIELQKDIQKSKSRSRSASRESGSRSKSRKSKSRSNSTENEEESQPLRSSSKSNSRSRSKSLAPELDPDDQDVKRQRKRSHSRESRNSKKTNTSSRSQSRQSENKSPSRKIPKNSDGDLLDLSNNEDDIDATT